MTLASVAGFYGLPLAELRAMRLWELNALSDHMAEAGKGL